MQFKAVSSNTRAKLAVLCCLICAIMLQFTAASPFCGSSPWGKTAVASTYAYAPYTSARAAVLMEASSGRVLYAKNEKEKLPMASCTKIMTAYSVLKRCNVTEQVNVAPQAVGIEGSSVYLKRGEQLTVGDLLYALMLRSGNDAAVALAIHVAGSVEKFAECMNKDAVVLGARNSNFVNPHGLHDDNHYTTAHDLGIITCAAFAEPFFAKVVATKSTVIGEDESTRHIANKNKLLSRYDDSNGVKTGFTRKAGRCFVGSARKDGMQLVAVVLNCGPMFEETEQLLRYGFDNYALTPLVTRNKVCLALSKGEQATFFVCPQPFSYPLRKDGGEKKLISYNVAQQDNQPEFQLYFAKQLIFSQKLVTI